MKKLLLLLLCVILIFSCGEASKENKEDVKENNIEEMKYSTSLTFLVDNDNLDDKELYALVDNDNLDDKELYAFIDIYTKKLNDSLINSNISRDNFSIKRHSKESTVYILTYYFNENKNSVDLLNNLFYEFINNNLNQKIEISRESIMSINKQITRSQDSLSLIENKLEEFKIKNPNLDIFEKDFGTFFQKQKTESNISQYQIYLGYYKELLSYLQNSEESDNIVSPTSMGISNPELNSLIFEFITLNSKKKELELSAKKNHQKYQSVLLQINYTKQSIIENLKNLISSTIIALKKEENRVNQFDSFIESLPKNQKEYIMIREELNILENRYIYLLNKRYETQIAIEGTISDIKIIDLASEIKKL